MSIPDIKLNDSHAIPQIGLGLWKVKDEAEFKTAFDTAIKTGYRHFDSAQVYGNEHMLGEAWKQSGFKRDELFLTTKVNIKNFGHDRVLESVEESLNKVQTDYFDLFLLHFPVTILRKQAWQALEEAQANGSARSIGVSNYTIRHLEEMEAYSKIVPAVNQVELHVFLQQPELIKYCQDRDIAIEAYSPIAHARVMDDPTIQKIADKHGKTYTQIMLRWLVEQDLVILPKSVTPSRIQENFEVFDFKLDEADNNQLATLDRDLRTCWSPVHVP